VKKKKVVFSPKDFIFGPTKGKGSYGKVKLCTEKATK